ncbi:DUF4156 domain-containing protein [Arenimonas fontis]|uniref:DUF4156 domain-containing protein n=1 Tax=Arenimonas fontis TaxID=2608255 RepID=A0A5B2Z7K8_9GAMM|nr:DUF4156 domain-containing protein [Arenimonas fontis]KAA2284738.1 DUF4156 domain-containing protein [Arenimonas fontis]
MRATRFFLAFGLGALLGACTWVKMAPGAENVRVVRAGQDMSACERRGEIAVSVKDRLGPYERNDIRVRDELEVLARNEAPGLGADTVQPKAEPRDGEQRFLAFRCGAARPGQAPARAAAQAAGEAETFPIED